MQSQRAWKPVEPIKNITEMERLHHELNAINDKIEALEKQHPDETKINSLKANALLLARQIDKLRCSSAADDLKDLLAR